MYYYHIDCILGPPWTISVFDRGSALAVTPDGLRVQSREQREWHGGRCTRGVQGNNVRVGFEATVTDEGLCRVGWSTSQATLDLGTDRFGFGFGGTGKKSNNKQFDDYGEAFGKSDIITCLLDQSKGEIKFLKNGVDLGTAFTINQSLKNAAFFPAVVLKVSYKNHCAATNIHFYSKSPLINLQTIDMCL